MRHSPEYSRSLIGAATPSNGRNELNRRHPLTRKDGEIHRAGYKIGYALVSTLENLAD
jgi:hypothetical protein